MATTVQKVWLIVRADTGEQVHTMIGGDSADEVAENANRLMGTRHGKLKAVDSGQTRIVCCGG